MNPCDISLYGILDPARTQGRGLVEMARCAAEGGVTLVQYRDKLSDTRHLIENARAIKTVLAPYDIPLLINDRVDVALAAAADGVHVGQSDMHPADVRSLMGEKALVGLTIKNEQHAADAPLELLDYVCAGGIYTTLSKNNPSNIGIEGWKSVRHVFKQRGAKLPVGAIAGIDETNLGDVLSAGADGAAIISAIFMADDVTAATQRLKSIVQEYLK